MYVEYQDAILENIIMKKFDLDDSMSTVVLG
jgi:hypothetical protein